MRLSAILLALLLTGCSSSSTPTQTCGLCGPVGVQPPAPDLVAQAMLDGRAQALTTCPAVADIDAAMAPGVSWQQCQFIVPDGHDTPGGASQSICSAGATIGMTIWISLAEPDRVLPLVTWEARNFYWLVAGCGDQAY
jgi:hypothetical protein